MNGAIARYIAGALLCAVVALAYSTTRKRGVRAILVDCLFCLGCMIAVVAVVAVAVYLITAMK